MSSFVTTGLSFLAEDSIGKQLKDRIFGLDLQVLFDSVILGCAVLFLFFLLSYLVFNPARELLKKRREKIQSDLDSAAKDKEEALAFKNEYSERLADVEKDVEQMMIDGKKKAQKKEQVIIDEANAEAKRIVDRATREAEQEKLKAQDEMKTEMVDIAAAMAGRFISASLDEKQQEELVQKTLQEMGEKTWQD